MWRRHLRAVRRHWVSQNATYQDLSVKTMCKARRVSRLASKAGNQWLHGDFATAMMGPLTSTAWTPAWLNFRVADIRQGWSCGPRRVECRPPMNRIWCQMYNCDCDPETGSS